ncbi:MAG: N-acetylmuramoyl-L-alanine amidase, partial [Bacteroidetes bacterium]
MEPRGNIARKEILREVFEDNLRTVRGEPSVRRPKRTLRPSRQGTILAVLAGFLLLASGAIYMGGLIRSVDAGAEPWVGRRTAGLPPVTERATAPPVLEPAGDEAVPGLPSRPTVAQLYGLTPRTIVIDPGHGGIDPGTSGQGGLTEKMVTLDVAHRLRARLARYPGYRVLLTREADERMSLRERIDFANEHRADLFISLHVNWVPDTSLVPIETYYYGPGSDARATRLAQRENRNAGYTLAEFNELTRQLGLELKIQESKALAGSIQNVLYRNMRRIDERVSNWGAKTGDF